MPVFHVSRAPEGALYVGRPSRWGNPFPLGKDTPDERLWVIARYRSWLWGEITSGCFSLQALAELDGRDLACYCSPKPCHADVLLEAAAWAASLSQESRAR